MKDYNRTLWENNKTVVDAEYLNNMEDQLLIITGSVNQEMDKVRVIEETLPMKASINHTHEDLATTTEIENIKTSIENLKLELQEEFKKYYDHAEIEDDTLKLYSNEVLLTSLKLPVGQVPVLKSICGEFLCGEVNCNDYPTAQSRSYEKTLWQDGVTPVNASNLNKIEDKLLELSQKLQELSDTGVDLADSFIHTGSQTPTSTKGIWIDNSDEEEVSLADPLVEQLAATIKKQQQQINELFYLTDAYLDDGEFEDEDDDSEILDGGIF